MKTTVSTIVLLLLILNLNAQLDSFNNHELKLVASAMSIMNSVETCALITISKDGTPTARTMAPFEPDENLIVWFGTNSSSRKVEQISQDPRVSLYYLDGDNSGYVQIQGRAEIINSEDAKQKYWKEEWQDFYPDYPEGFSLIKVTPIRMEIVSERLGIISEEKNWEVPNVIFDK